MTIEERIKRASEAILKDIEKLTECRDQLRRRLEDWESILESADCAVEGLETVRIALGHAVDGLSQHI